MPKTISASSVSLVSENKFKKRLELKKLAYDKYVQKLLAIKMSKIHAAIKQKKNKDTLMSVDYKAT